MITYKKIIDDIKDISLRHLLVKDFGAGQTYEIGENRDMMFPYIWITNTRPSTIITENHAVIVEFNITMVVSDLIVEMYRDNEMPDYNGLEAHDNCVLIFLDMVKYLQNIYSVSGISFEFAYDDTDDRTNSIVGNFIIRVPLNSCASIINKNNC